MILGTTYSHKHIDYLSLDNEKAFDDLLNLKFNIIRLCCYWSEIQPRKDTYDFSAIKSLLDKCERENQDVLLTIGMKSPRWPEFYIPSWIKEREITSLSDEIISFIEKTVSELKNYSCIKYWQIENEPLDPSGPSNATIPLDLLEKEIEVIKTTNDTKDVVVNVWGNETEQRGTFSKAERLSDIVGLDIYTKVPIDEKTYDGPRNSQEYYKRLLSNSLKPVWITELQAEPWEKDKLVSQSENPPSINSETLLQNFNYAKSLNPRAILLWGYEYWYWRRLNGDLRLWNTVNELLAAEL